MKKCRKQDDAVLFIDSSQHFQKIGNQNTLTDVHVAKIVNTYELRESSEKYSHLASLDEIRENVFNLNIPRYVDTFEEEEQVDLEHLSNELINIEKKMKTIRYNDCEVLSRTRNSQSILTNLFETP